MNWYSHPVSATWFDVRGLADGPQIKIRFEPDLSERVWYKVRQEGPPPKRRRRKRL